ncbi:hypothetical protein H4Q26_010169 [Puccinia striiformis f. sp. tritici PST-130]|nr:hypothetical protein H4Q26_010169 [Puccinia striiformis f. sp. tritici PST-130]
MCTFVSDYIYMLAMLKTSPLVVTLITSSTTDGTQSSNTQNSKTTSALEPEAPISLRSSSPGAASGQEEEIEEEEQLIKLVFIATLLGSCADNFPDQPILVKDPIDPILGIRSGLAQMITSWKAYLSLDRTRIGLEFSLILISGYLTSMNG